MKVYIGYDVRDDLAFRACVASLVKHSSIDLDIIPLKEHELRRKGVYWRSYRMTEKGQRFDDRDGKPFSTEFSFTRFGIPLVDNTDEWVLFIDADMLFLQDIAKLVDYLEEVDENKALLCVQHDYKPKEATKFDGMLQETYFRKNWSSFMLLRPARCTITPYVLNNQSGSFLHALLWQADEDIGKIDESWNWLEGWSDPVIKPNCVHFTRGTPDMLGDKLPYAKEWWIAANEWQPGMNRNGLDG